MEITKDTRVSEILEEYGDIAEVMELFGVKPVGRYSLRALIAKALTPEEHLITGQQIERCTCLEERVVEIDR